MPGGNLPHVQNPLLKLRAAEKFQALPYEAKVALREALLELSAEARAKAQHSWEKRKAPMAAYHYAVAVYARQFARLLRAS